MTLIESLWYGTVAMSDRVVHKDSEYDKLTQCIIQHEDQLKETLTDKQTEIFEKLKANQNERNTLGECEAFTIGFKLGVKLMYETMK
ncbi:DUF6809 family protein [Ruminococcus sp. zg-924]|uniref:DUF6809 family protein n=1 Tax=Ruminococcus sp. zg-924 TaxID=2678505 RepID=UPI00210C57E5|nr:DUF6809 family protein [Ruminococcus sp. zg-924]MCQ4022839.1 hypothetical protein [Ruminococcus sp. zg-924]